MKRILSGIKPTSNLTLGNYIGALRPWVQGQYDAENFFMIADYHAITVPQEPKSMHDLTYELAAAYIAAGLDTDHNAFFVQSHIPAHAELGWILTCQAPMGWLKRMTQFKDKAGKKQDAVGAGLFTYPALMAADILMYDATHVPVGDDQKQHVELTRDLAIAFNHRFGDVFVIPEPVIQAVGARVMSLRDGTKKMSKSDESDMSRINMLDTADMIADKFKRARTDSGVMPDTVEDMHARPEVANLISIYAALSGEGVQQIIDRYAGQNFAPFKSALADVAIQILVPIGTQMQKLLNDRPHLDSLLAKGREKAEIPAQKTLKRVKEVMGFVAKA